MNLFARRNPCYWACLWSPWKEVSRSHRIRHRTVQFGSIWGRRWSWWAQAYSGRCILAFRRSFAVSIASRHIQNAWSRSAFPKRSAGAWLGSGGMIPSEWSLCKMIKILWFSMWAHLILQWRLSVEMLSTTRMRVPRWWTRWGRWRRSCSRCTRVWRWRWGRCSSLRPRTARRGGDWFRAWCVRTPRGC